jgi:hypothetical protein
MGILYHLVEIHRQVKIVCQSMRSFWSFRVLFFYLKTRVENDSIILVIRVSISSCMYCISLQDSLQISLTLN